MTLFLFDVYILNTVFFLITQLRVYFFNVCFKGGITREAELLERWDYYSNISLRGGINIYSMLAD